MTWQQAIVFVCLVIQLAVNFGSASQMKIQSCPRVDKQIANEKKCDEDYSCDSGQKCFRFKCKNNSGDEEWRNFCLVWPDRFRHYEWSKDDEQPSSSSSDKDKDKDKDKKGKKKHR